MSPDNALFSLPERLRGLEDLAYNLWWSWHPAARELFRGLDLQLWRESGHNPIRLLAMAPATLLADAAQDAAFLAHYDAVMAQF